MLELRQDRLNPNQYTVVEHSERGERIVAYCVEWSYRDGFQIDGDYEPLQREVNMRFRLITGYDFTQPQRRLPEPPVVAEIITKKLRGGATREPLKLTHDKE